MIIITTIIIEIVIVTVIVLVIVILLYAPRSLKLLTGCVSSRFMRMRLPWEPASWRKTKVVLVKVVS